MDYEELYLQLQVLEKDFKDKISSAQKSFKSLAKNSDKGDLKGLSKDLSQMNNFIKNFENLVTEYTQLTEGFDAKEYMEKGDFARQMVEYCEKLSVDIKGTYPTYEVFPYKVKIDGENCELSIDRKKLQCVRPQYFVKLIKQSQEKLNKASFNEETFLNELAAAYDTALIKKESNNTVKKSEPDILLYDLYAYMVPMNRFRKEYDMQSYAFDLARLYTSEAEKKTKDGRFYDFGTTRTTKKLIRILDRNGNEYYLGTIRFFTR